VLCESYAETTLWQGGRVAGGWVSGREGGREGGRGGREGRDREGGGGGGGGEDPCRVAIALRTPPMVTPDVNIARNAVFPIISVRRTICGGVPGVLLLGRSPLLPFRLLGMVHVDVEPEFDCTLFRFEG